MIETEIITTFHVSLAIPFARSILLNHQRDGKPQQCFINMNTGKHPGYKAVFKILDEYEKHGYRVIPPCDNIKKDGSCAGHKK